MKRRRPVDLVAVRAARTRLDVLVREHPELRGPSGAKNVDGWVTTLEREDAMADTEQVAFRLPKALVARLDAHVVQLAAEQPGMVFTRTDVVRLLLTKALDDNEAKKGTTGARRR